MERLGFLVVVVAFAALACGEDATTRVTSPSPTVTDDDTGNDVDPTPDAGTPADDTTPTDDVDDGDLADVYTLEFEAPAGATEVVLRGNLRGDWNDELLRVHDRAIVWRGRLDYDRLDLPACTPDAHTAGCGYIVVVWFDVEPYFSCVLDPAGNFREVSRPSVEGPLKVETVSVENGLNGCNHHLRLVRAAPR